MPKIVPIVEGDGETTAVPVLLYKILHELNRYDIQVAPAKNAHGRGNLLATGGVEKFVKHAWRERDCAAVVVMLDAEGDCPVELARILAKRVEAMGVLYSVVIVCARQMYESWFLASVQTIAGRELQRRPGLRPETPVPEDPEAVVNAKAWLTRRMPAGRSYKETADQEAMTRLLDPMIARDRSRSFRRLCHAVEEVVAAIDSEQRIVTPSSE